MEEGAFRRSKKMERSPAEKDKQESKGKKRIEGVEEERGEERMVKWIREEVRGIVREVKKEIREVAKGQEEGMQRELAKIKKDLLEREERWEKERRKIREKIR